jgi:hypothetical protein
MQLVGIFLCTTVKIMFVHEFKAIKISFITHKQIVNFIFVHMSQEFPTKICMAEQNVFAVNALPLWIS